MFIGMILTWKIVKFLFEPKFKEKSLKRTFTVPFSVSDLHFLICNTVIHDIDAIFQIAGAELTETLACTNLSENIQ